MSNLFQYTAVKYHDLSVLLLNELQKLAKEVQELRTQLNNRGVL